MNEKPFNVLFLCTGNSARSILAESLLNQWGRGRFVGFSAGSHPKGAVHPIALELLKNMKVPTASLRSKSWDEFATPGAPEMDFVFTVCDDAAGEVCPIWPGQPMTAHWGIADPAAVVGPIKSSGTPSAPHSASWTAESRSSRACRSARSTESNCKSTCTRLARAPPLTKSHKSILHPLIAEWLGALLLAAAVIGSGIMAERLADGNLAVALIANTFATVAALAALIAMLGPISGAHFNPVISLVEAARGILPGWHAAGYCAVQVLDAAWARCWRMSCLICRWSKPRPTREPADRNGVGRGRNGRPGARRTWLPIGARGRMARARLDRGGVLVYRLNVLRQPRDYAGTVMSDTFAGIRPIDAPGFIGAQLVGGLVGLLLARRSSATRRHERLREFCGNESCTVPHRGAFAATAPRLIG